MEFKKRRLHVLADESPAFEYFIYSCLKAENKIFDRYEHNEEIIFDFYAPNGINGIYNKACFIDIRYHPSLLNLCDFVKRLPPNHIFILIGLWDESHIVEFNKSLKVNNIILLGKTYIKQLINKFPENWWCFAGSYDENATIELDRFEEFAILNTSVLGFEEVKTQVKLSNINKISSANEIEFKRLISNNNFDVALILGNGISIPFGSDSWNKMTNSIFDYLSPFYIDDLISVKDTIGNNSYFISSFSKLTLPTKYYESALWNSVYKKYDASKMHISSSLIRMIVEIKHDFQSAALITYNYDEFVENDYYSKYKTKLNQVLDKNETIQEPKIFHVHGLIPYVGESKNVILTDDEYYDAYRNQNTFTYLTQLHALLNKVTIYVGSSMSDLYQLSVIRDAKISIESKNDVDKLVHKMFKCFALICLKNIKPKDKLYILNYYLRKGIFIIWVDNFDELPIKLRQLFKIQ